jgi:hypothetical protein
MRHLLAMPVLCAALIACTAPAAPHPGGTFTLERGQRLALAQGVSLSFDTVEDSRCPPGVRCAWAGKLSYRFSIRRGDAADTFTLSPDAASAAPQTLDGRRIELDTSNIPAPPAPGTTITYRATLTITPP